MNRNWRQKANFVSFWKVKVIQKIKGKERKKDKVLIEETDHEFVRESNTVGLSIKQMDG